MNNLQKEIILHYKGIILYDTIGDLITELKEKMYERHIKQAVYKKVLMVMIEALENVFKYNENFEKETEIIKKYPPEIHIAKMPDCFSITVSNPVKVSDTEFLEQRLKKINSLDKKGVKTMYKEIITNGQFSEKGGAGLGIIEMAKISDGKMNYLFSSINETYNYFKLNLRIRFKKPI